MDKDKEDKEYEIIRDSDNKVKQFSFGELAKSTKQNENKKEESEKQFKVENLDKIVTKENISKNKTKKDLSSKNITNKVWEKVKKEDIKNYKNISENDKDKIIQTIFGTDKQRPKICYSCGQEIKGEFYSFRTKENSSSKIDEIYICSNCLYGKPVCKNCGLPLVNSNTFQTLCNYCKPNGKCDCCGNEFPNNKNLVNIVDVKGVFCKECLSIKDKCWSCGKPITKGFKLSDGRQLCSYCQPISLLDGSSILQKYEETINLINRIFGIKGNINCSVIYVNDAIELNPNRQEKCKFAVENKKVYLKVAIGIREDHLIGFVTEEYAKIIALQIKTKVCEEPLKSDFALWIKYLILRKYNYNEEFFRIKEEKTNSSRFFKWLNSVDRSKGAKIVLSNIREGLMKY